MVLGGVGDALGFKNGHWEFCMNGLDIHRELAQLGGVRKIRVALPNWRVSDDTVMHIATAKALVKHGHSGDKNELIKALAMEYKNCMSNMKGRQAGITCIKSCEMLDPRSLDGCRVPFNKRGGGCGAAMRAMCIGLRYPDPDQIEDLIAVSIESGILTHHHPTGYLGALAAALFTSYAIQGKNLFEWGASLLEVLPRAKTYILNSDIDEKEENITEWDYFGKRWLEYLLDRKITEPNSEPVFPITYGVSERDDYYKTLSFHNWGGNSGHDAPMIAYDALLGCNGNWEELCNRAMFHGGDSDSTGTIAGCLFGAMHGFESVPKENYKDVEFRKELEDLSLQLCKLRSTPEESSKPVPSVYHGTPCSCDML